jgi:hypothetical protein
MTPAEPPSATPVWDELSIGDELPPFTYMLTQKMIDDYRAIIENPTAAYPTVAGRHPARSFYSRYKGLARVPNMGQEAWYFNPPRPDTEITVTAHVADKYERRGNRYIVIEARSFDWSGRFIETTRLIARLKEKSEPALEKVGSKWGY